MRRSILSLVCFGLGLVATGVLPALGGEEVPPQAEIDRLDAAIQARFQITDPRKFGFSRIPTKHPAMQQMDPQTDGEKSVLRSLTEKGWTVALYAARSPRIQHSVVPAPAAKARTSKVAGDQSTQFEVEGHPSAFRSLPAGKPAGPLLVMVGPLQLTGRATQTPKLTASDEQVRKLLADAMSGKEARLGMDRWQLIARPVRAGKEACVFCHAKVFDQKLKVGDPLGVAIYAFTPNAGK